ncbi:iron complex transport system permease protein [Methylosinus sp. sav-2]|uniref:FecCD family ABC transporter permease n=1 Tax=Methylosinus sp. sav-2 TaxID=2485168 RepID=UPI00047B5A06|nr:iron ABC transporter permease [Methylosinus sp. sav-2]TDX60511.1 iron complex transport system permease protein [Methylosinus sp. sav-2]
MSLLVTASGDTPQKRALPRWVRALAVLVLLLVAALTALCVGRFQIAPQKAIAILLSRVSPLTADWSAMDERIILLVRAPRVLLAALCGAGLAVSGAALQGVFRNPLVAPQILGVSPGAAFGGALAISLGFSGFALIGAAFAFGAVALALVGVLARVEGRSDTVMLVLTGVVIGALFAALVSLLQFLADPNSSLPAIVFWLMGSFSAATWARLGIAAPGVLAGAAMLWLMRFRINVLSLGEEEARALGLSVERDRWLVFAAVALIEGAAVAVAGVVGWVGLVVPHAARLLVGSDQRALLPVSAALGASYLLLVDSLARSATAAEIPLGVITALIGAPVFAALLRQTRRKELAG